MNDETKDTSRSYTREELYDLVWSRPMTELAKEHGLSDNGFRKKCKKYNIPLPKAGYWAKKKFGKEGPRPPLPVYEGRNTIEIRNETCVNLDIDREKQCEAGEVVKQIEFESLDENKIRVLATLSTPHPLISQLKSVFREPQREGPRGGNSYRGSAYLDIRVTKGSLDRALRIANALIKAAEKREMKISIVKEISPYSNSTREFTAATVLGENVQFYIKEIVHQKKIEYDSEAKRRTDFWRMPLYEHIPTGMLTLSIQERTSGRHRLNWTDGTKQKIENCLNDFMVALVRSAVFKRNDRLESERRERERIEEGIRRFEEEKRRKEEAAKLNALIQETKNWQTSLLIRSYVEALKTAQSRKAGISEPDSELNCWITWALEQADKLDSLNSRLACGPNGVKLQN